MAKVMYTGKMEIGGSGIGSTAMHQVGPLYKERLLHKIYAPSLKAPKDMPTLNMFMNPILTPHYQTYFEGDVMFDTFTSLQMQKPDILQTWLNHSYSQLCKYPDAIKIVNLFSAHPDKQAELVKLDTSDPIIKLSLKRQRDELELADYILVPSQFALESLEERNLGDKAVVMPFGVDLDKFKPGKKSGDNTFRVIFVGSNWHRKGGPLLLEAWDKLDLKNSELIICGTSSDVVGETKDNVKVGWVPDLVETLQQANVFCLPALEDGCPLATHEAMACGIPAIVTESTGTKDYIKEGVNGYIIEPDSVDEICSVLQYLKDMHLNDRTMLESKGKAARMLIEDWPWKRYEDQYIEFIKGLI